MSEESFKDIPLIKSYYSDRQNILHEFYIPVLSRSVKYKRIAGFFSSSALAVAARGIAGLIKMKGKIELITSANLSDADVKAIKEAIDDPIAIIEQSAITALDDIESELERDHVSGLAWMLAEGMLEMKIAITVDRNGFPLDPGLLASIGIMHQKIGIFDDVFGNSISFSGSINESRTAWLYNIEQFKVYRSWIPEENEYLVEDREAFERLWNNTSPNAVVYSLTNAVKKKILELKPETPEELGRLLLRLEQSSEMKSLYVGDRELWSHQKEAVESWVSNNYVGIFEMATGTGKTLAALAGIQTLRENIPSFVTVISTPYQHLTTQWLNEVEILGMSGAVVIADSDHPKWDKKLKQFLLDVNLGIVNDLIVFTTHDTLSSDLLRKLLRDVDKDVLLIVDEVHSAGSPVRKEGLDDSFKYRLGLSATPRRWLDDVGTDQIYSYFDRTVYDFPLRKAIKTINPSSGETYLCPYDYKLVFVSLTDDELEKYEKDTLKISRLYHAAKNDIELRHAFEMLCINRAKIVTNAQAKYDAFNILVGELIEKDAFHHCLIYCSPQQINEVQEMLVNKGVKQHKFTQYEDTKKRDELGGISERELLIQDLAIGSLDALVSMKCLDEGVDVPPAKTAIILASSGNPREYIQRRGRVLRRSPGKDQSTIYDFIVSPSPFNKIDSQLSEIEVKIIRKELERCKEFAAIAKNATECLGEINEIIEMLGVE